VILAPQPKAAMAAAAMPARDNTVKPSTAPVHLGQTFGVTPNPNAQGQPRSRQSETVRRHEWPGVRRTEWLARPESAMAEVRVELRSGRQGGLGRHSGATGTAPSGSYSGSKVASTGIPAAVAAAPSRGSSKRR